MRDARGPATAQIKRNLRGIRHDLPVTKVLIALNAMVFVLGQGGQAWFKNEKLGLVGPWVAGGDWWRIVTAGFIHFGILHIAFNMYALYSLGNAMENQLGSMRFLGVYVVALLGGSLGALAFEPNGLVGGASGAVFGLFGALAVAMRQRGISVMKSSLGPTLLINFVITFAIPGIAVGGHIGGFLFGGLAGGAMLNPRRRGRNAAQDAAVLVLLGVVAVAGALYLAKHPLNGGRGLWPRNTNG